MINYTGLVYVENNVTSHTDAVYDKIRAELLRLIGQDAIYHEKKIGQQREPSYKCDLSIIRY